MGGARSQDQAVTVQLHDDNDQHAIFAVSRMLGGPKLLQPLATSIASWGRQLLTSAASRGFTTSGPLSRQQMAAPLLTFWERNPPFAALAAAKLSGAVIDAKPDPKATKDTIATLTFPSG